MPPLVEISANQLLSDEERMKRLMAKFCDVIYAHVDQDAIDRSIDESMRICGVPQETLAAVIQTKFFVGHTPFYWAIVNKDPKHTGVPPLLEKLFGVCSNAVDATTEDDVMLALMLSADPGDDLYRLIGPRLRTLRRFLAPSYFQGEGQQPTVRGTSRGEGWKREATAEFSIPLFFDRLTLEKSLSLTFIAIGEALLISSTSPLLRLALCSSPD